MARKQQHHSVMGKANRGLLAPRRCRFEQLESRHLLSASALAAMTAHPLATPAATNSTPVGYTPAQIQHAYGFDQVTFANGAVRGDGSGQTIAIVDAYDDPNIASDLKVFDKQFKLPDPPSFTKVNQSGGTQAPRADGGWSQEIALDVEWAHAVAPGANILLVEARSASISDLMAAVNYARNQSAVSVVSMSWGGGEFAGETSYDASFSTPAGHGGVTFVAASGDQGDPAGWPAVSPNVLAVGGTTLKLSSSNTRTSETAWSGSGGGYSQLEAEPSYQQGVQTSGSRTVPDVAYNADPRTGFAVYDSVRYGGQSGWLRIGGTSAGAPQWAGLAAIANQGRALSGGGSLSNVTADVYALSSSDFYDITSGSNNLDRATKGYDLVTGLGSPQANLVIQQLVGLSAEAANTGSSTPVNSGRTHSVYGWGVFGWGGFGWSGFGWGVFGWGIFQSSDMRAWAAIAPNNEAALQAASLVPPTTHGVALLPTVVDSSASPETAAADQLAGDLSLLPTADAADTSGLPTRLEGLGLSSHLEPQLARHEAGRWGSGLTATSSRRDAVDSWFAELGEAEVAPRLAEL